MPWPSGRPRNGVAGSYAWLGRARADVRARDRAQSAWVRSVLTPVTVLVALAAGIVLHATGAGHAADVLWTVVLIAVIVPLAFTVVRRMLHGQLGADVIALLAIAGSLALGELAAGLVVALMLSGGELLEERAFRRARRELSALARRAPAVAHRRDASGLVDVPAGEVQAGDRLVVLAGEIVPVDCRLVERPGGARRGRTDR